MKSEVSSMSILRSMWQMRTSNPGKLMSKDSNSSYKLNGSLANGEWTTLSINFEKSGLFVKAVKRLYSRFEGCIKRSGLANTSTPLCCVTAPLDTL